MVLIRPAAAADAAHVAAVQREGWLAAYQGIIPAGIIDRVTAPDAGARIRRTFRVRPWQQMLVAVAPDQDDRDPAPGGIAGYACFGPETDVLTTPWPHPLTAAGRDGRVAELYALYVRPAWWSTGTGRALMDQVLTGSAEAGFVAIRLWVLQDNARARRFYERAGFAADGTAHVLRHLGGVTEVRYRRALRLRRGHDRAGPGVPVVR